MARRRRGQFVEPREEKGQWKIRYWVDEAQPDGSLKRVRKTKCLGSVDSMTQTEAHKEAVRFLQPINDVEEGVEHSGKTVRDLVRKWREAIKPTLKRSTQENYEWVIEQVEKAFGKVPLAAVGRADIQTFLTAAGRRLASETVRGLRGRLSGLFSAAESWGWLRPGTNPVRGKLRLPPRRPVRQKRVLGRGEFQKLASALPQPYGTIVVLAALAGLRRGELAALRWRDNSRPGVLVVDESVYKGTLDTPKTAKSNREVSIGPTAQKAIDAWRARARFTTPDSFMFGQRKDVPIDLKNAVARHVKPAAKAIGIGPVSWHDLRHTYTTWGRLAGIKAETMRDLLGHSSVLMTLDLYSHASDPGAEAAIIEQWAYGNDARPQAVQ